MTKPLTAQQIADQAEDMVVPEISEILPIVAAVKTTPPRRRILATKCLPQAVGWSQLRKAKYAGVSPRTWYVAERDPKFRTLALEFVKSRFGDDVPEILAAYIKGAKDGDRVRQERILEQVGILDKPEKGGTNITLTLTIEQKIEFQKKRESNQSRGLEALGYTLHTDN